VDVKVDSGIVDAFYIIDYQGTSYARSVTTFSIESALI
jgi:hypothetical protein